MRQRFILFFNALICKFTFTFAEINMNKDNPQPNCLNTEAECSMIQE